MWPTVTTNLKPSHDDMLRLNSETIILATLEAAGGQLNWSGLRKKTQSQIRSSRTLSDRLKGLLEIGVVRRMIGEGNPPKITYQITSKKVLMDIDSNRELRFYRQLFNEIADSRKTFKYMLKTGSPSEVIEMNALDFLHDFLFTIQYAAERKITSRGLVLMSVGLYQARLDNLISSMAQNPEMVKAAKDLWREYHDKKTFVIPS